MTGSLPSYITTVIRITALLGALLLLVFPGMWRCRIEAASPVAIAGQVLDAGTGAPLSEANITISDSLGTFCDAEGRFSLNVLPGTYQVTVSIVGYSQMVQEIRVPDGGLEDLVFRLEVELLPMDETVVERLKMRLPVFTDVTREAGIDFEHIYGESPLRNILQTTGSGVCFFDYDGDHFQDFYLVNEGYLDREAAEQPTNALYRNNGDGTFTDVTVTAGVGDTGYGMGCATADYDNDGDMDLFVTNYGPNALYRNEADGTFSDVSEQAGLADSSWSVGTGWADYDNDGYLDLFVGNYLEFEPWAPTVRNLVSLGEGYRMYPGPRDYEGQPDRLYRNRGDGTFTDVSEQVGLNPLVAKAMGCGFGDYDSDGDMDLFVSNDRTPNHLYRNDEGRFTEVALWAGVAYDEAGHESGAMSVNFADYDNDGRMDLFVTNFIFEYNSLWRYLGGDSFADVTLEADLAMGTFSYVAWGGIVFDYDNDGYLDIYVANGHVHENIDVLSEGFTFAQPNQLFHSDGDGTFTEVSSRSGSHFIDSQVSRGVAYADYDNDGDLDILVNNLGDRPNLLRNDGGNRENWLAVHPIGGASNRNAIGSRVWVRAGQLEMMREVHSGSSYLSQDDMRLFFGLGSHRRVDSLRIRWPSGRIDSLENIAANRLLILREGEGHVEYPSPSADSRPN